MNKVISLDKLLQTHHVATSTRVVWDLLKNEATQKNVYIRNLFFDEFFPIDDIAIGPFIFTETSEGGEISGIDLLTRKVAFLRIAQNIEKTGSVEIKNEIHLEWHRPAMDGIRIYIPF